MPVRARSQTDVLAWHEVEGMAKHDEHDMGGHPRKQTNPRSPRGANDCLHRNDVGQSQKPEWHDVEGMVRHDDHDTVRHSRKPMIPRSLISPMGGHP